MWIKDQLKKCIIRKSTLKSCLFPEEIYYSKKEKKNLFQNKHFIIDNAKEGIFTTFIRKEEKLQ